MTTCDHYAERHQTIRLGMICFVLLVTGAIVWFWGYRHQGITQATPCASDKREP